MSDPFSNRFQSALKALVLLYIVLALTPRHALAMGGSVPSGLKCTFMLGMQNSDDATQTSWFTGSGSPWDIRYQYLSGGVNTGSLGNSQWRDDWGSANYALNYANASNGMNAIPCFTYYQIYGSDPGGYGSEIPSEIQNLQTASTMDSYFKDFKALMQQCKTYNKPIIIHLEPDFWGNMAIYCNSTYGNYNAANIPVSVAGSGNADAAGYANNFQGFAQCLIHLRDTYGSTQTYLAYHFSHWVNNDLFYQNVSQAQIDSDIANVAIPFYNSCTTPKKFDLFFSDPSDRDSDYYYNCGLSTTCDLGASDATHWWSIAVTTIGGQPNFTSAAYILNSFSTQSALRGMLWQVPVGNCYYKTCNNSDGHFRDNRVEAFLPPVASYSGPTDSASMIGKYAASGIIGILWGSGRSDNSTWCGPPNPTRQYDIGGGTTDTGDGITNGANVCSHPGGVLPYGSVSSTVSDDDGGYLRNGGVSYYSKGAYSICGTPTNTPTNTFTNTATKTFTATATRTATNTATNTIVMTATNTPTSTATSSATNSSTPTATKTATNTVTNTGTNTSTNSPTNTATFTPTRTPTNTATSSSTNTATNTPGGNTATNTFTNTATNTVTSTATKTATGTATNTATNSSTNTVTNTSTSTPTKTVTPTATNSSTSTATDTPGGNTPTNTGTNTVTNTVTNTATKTPTSTVTNTATNSWTNTMTNTVTSTSTKTATNTSTGTPTMTSTNTATDTLGINTPTNTATNSVTNTPVNTSTNTASNTATRTPTNTATNTATNSATKTPTNTATNTATDTPGINTPTNTSTNSVTNTPVNTATNTGTNTATGTATNTATSTSTNTSTLTVTSTGTPTATNTPTRTATVTSTVTVTSTPVNKVIFAGPYPNPVSNGPVKVDVTTPGSATIEVDVFTTAFRKIAEHTVEATASSPGYGTVTTVDWDLKDRQGKSVADGLYYLRIQVHGIQDSTKIVKVLVLK